MLKTGDVGKRGLCPWAGMWCSGQMTLTSGSGSRAGESGSKTICWCKAKKKKKKSPCK